MAFSKSDLSDIKQAVKEVTEPQSKKLEKKIDKIDKKFDELFDYLDKDVSSFKRKVADHLDIPVSELSISSK